MEIRQEKKVLASMTQSPLQRIPSGPKGTDPPPQKKTGNTHTHTHTHTRTRVVWVQINNRLMNALQMVSIEALVLTGMTFRFGFYLVLLGCYLFFFGFT